MPLWTIFTKCPAPTGPQCRYPSSAVPSASVPSGVRVIDARPGASDLKIGSRRSTALPDHRSSSNNRARVPRRHRSYRHRSNGRARARHPCARRMSST